MRRAILVFSLLVLGFAGAPPPAAASSDRAWCEGYCVVVGGGCYVFFGLFVGKDKCAAMYEGCVDGCVAALVDREPEPDAIEPKR
jgi:hypothetical protein